MWSFFINRKATPPVQRVKMRATITKEYGKKARNWNGDKELIHWFVLVARTPEGKYLNLIDARCWMTRGADGASPMYAAVWIYDCGSGSGKATGYGYHKMSASIADAIANAGVILEGDISDRGEIEVREALTAIAAELGFNDVHVVE